MVPVGAGRARPDGDVVTIERQAHHRRLPAAGPDQEATSRPASPTHPGVRDVTHRVGRDDERGARPRSCSRPAGHARENAPDTADPRHDPRPRHRVGQGRRRQELGHRQPRRRHRGRWATPSACSTPTSGASRCRACSACRAGWKASEGDDGSRQHPPERTPRRRRPAEGRVDRLPRRRRGHRADVARPHAHQGGRAVPPRRAVGRARLPAHRHAARHRRRADGPGPDAAAHRPHHRHHAGRERAEGRDPGRRHGPAQRSCGSPA